MADTTVTVNQGGGADYTVLQTAIDDSDVATGFYKVEVQDAVAYVENITAGGSTGTPTIANYLWITATDAAYHGGTVGTGARISPSAAGNSIDITEDYVRLHKLLVELSTASANSNECVRVNGGTDILVERCILDAQARNRTTSDGDCFYCQNDADTPLTCYNTLMIDADRGWVDLFNYDGTINLEFCTAYRCAITETNGGQRQGYMYPRGGATTAVANIYNTVGGFNGYAEVNGKGASQTIFHSEDADATVNGANNAADNNLAFNDISATGFVANIVHADAWTDPTNFDLTILDTDSDLYLAGTDRSGSLPDSRADATIDIAGTTRPATPSIGAYEIAAAGPDRSITAEHTAFLAEQVSSLEVLGELTAEHNAFLAQQASTIAVLSDITAEHTAFLATQDATIAGFTSIDAEHNAFLANQQGTVEVLAAVTAENNAFLATQTSALTLRVTLTGEHFAFLATQTASAEVLSDIFGEHNAFLATQNATIATVDTRTITGEHTAFLANQTSTLEVLVQTSAEHTAFLATQDATAEVLVELTAEHTAFLATQDATAEVLAALTGEHTAFLATQQASLVQGDVRVITGQHTAFLANQAATLDNIIQITGSQAAFLATQQAPITVQVDITSEHNAFLASQVSSLEVLTKIDAEHNAFLATQDATILPVAPGIIAEHNAFLATQQADLALRAAINANQTAFLANQSAQLQHVSFITADHNAFLATQTSLIVQGSLPALGISGLAPIVQTLKGASPTTTNLRGRSP